MKVVIIGLGSIALKHIKALKEIDEDIEIYALRHKKENSKIIGIVDVHNYDQIQKIQPDFVIISNPTVAHYDSLKNIAFLKKPIFIEKPLFSSIGKIESELVNSLELFAIKTYVACNLRFLECIKVLKEEIVPNIRINEVNVYCGSHLPTWRTGVDFRTSYSANKEMGGGVELDLIHELDYVYWLFGEPIKNFSFYGSKSSLDISAHDYANFLWEYPGFFANITLNYYRKEAKRQIEIVTTEDVFIVDLLKNVIYKNHEIYFKSDRTILDTYLTQMQTFLSFIKNEETYFNSIAEAYKVLNLCLTNENLASNR